LKSILLDEYLEDVIFGKDFYLENGKVISRIWVQLNGVCINNKQTWNNIFDFFNDKMTSFEMFFLEYEDYIRDLEINT
jgi:hypothetical protein